MLLRKCIKELGSRTTVYIEQCVKMEREYTSQVPTRPPTRQQQQHAGTAGKALALARRGGT